MVKSILIGMPNNKALGLDGIPNKVLKTVCLDLAEPLAEAISKYLAVGTLLELYKKLTIVVLRKDRKRNYSLPSSYRPIVLENTLAKLVEKIVTNHIATAAEEHALLL